MNENFRLGVVEARELDRQALEALLSMNAMAVRVRGFLEPALCQRLSTLLREDVMTAGSSGSIYQSNVDSFWSARSDPQLLDHYLSAAAPLEERLRRLSAPLESPLDSFRRCLEDAWSAGAVANSTSGRDMPFGITRLWEIGSEALPHQDVLWREVSEDCIATTQQGQRAQLAVNLYLDTAREGGELEIWDYVVDEHQYTRCKQQYAGSYGFPRQHLPKTSLLLTPEAGDLILINSLRVHAVRKVVMGRRITLSGFIGKWGEDEPLRCWS